MIIQLNGKMISNDEVDIMEREGNIDGKCDIIDGECDIIEFEGDIFGVFVCEGDINNGEFDPIEC